MTEWPPNYSKLLSERANRLQQIHEDPNLGAGAREYYRDKPVEFIEDWCCTFDPRNSNKGLPTLMPFILFPKQKEFVQFLQECLEGNESGLVEKSRDMGATWVCSAFSVWLWLYSEGASVGWGSRKEALVDKIGDPDSIFQKIRMIIKNLPSFLKPRGFDPKKHAFFMKIINPENQATITGEGGDNIGRGGRKLIYFKDEAQPLDAKVLTPFGWRTMGDLAVGDFVMSGATAAAVQITQVKDFSKRRVYELEFENGARVRASENHLWSVSINGEDRRLVRTNKLYKHLRKDRILRTPSYLGGHQPRIVGINKVRKMDVRCISLKSEDGLYVTDDFIVTHNSAHYERPELIEAALGDNTNVQIDISSVNGLGNIFHTRRENGVDWIPGLGITKGRTQVFVMAWDDHPAKTQAWYDEREAKAKADGLIAVFRQEVDRSYTGAIQNLVIPAEWVTAAIDSDKKLNMKTSGKVYAGLDVADEGGDKNSLAIRNGSRLIFAEAWGEGDTFSTAEKAIRLSVPYKVQQLAYDCIGVGAGVKAAFNRMQVPQVSILPWNASSAALNPERHIIRTDRQSPKNKDFYANLKSQGWWELRNRFHKTYQAVMTKTVDRDDELICIPGDLPNLREIRKELSQPTFLHDGKGRIIIDKKPDGTKSPNLADSIVMAFWQKDQGTFYSG